MLKEKMAPTARSLGRVLIIEKDQILITLLQNYLKKAGAQWVDQVSNKAEIIAKINRETYDLVVVDWKFRDPPGPEIYVNIRGSSGAADTPIVLIAGSLTVQDLQQIKGDRDTRFVIKPFPEEVFLDILKKGLNFSIKIKKNESKMQIVRSESKKKESASTKGKNLYIIKSEAGAKAGSSLVSSDKTKSANANSQMVTGGAKEGGKNSGVDTRSQSKTADPWDMKVEDDLPFQVDSQDKKEGDQNKKSKAADPWDMKVEDDLPFQVDSQDKKEGGENKKSKTSDPWEMKIEADKSSQPDSWDMKIENPNKKSKTSDPWEMKIEADKSSQPDSWDMKIENPNKKSKTSDPWEMKIEADKSSQPDSWDMKIENPNKKSKTSDPWEMKIEADKSSQPDSWDMKIENPNKKSKTSYPWEMKIEADKSSQPDSWDMKIEGQNKKGKTSDPWEMKIEADKSSQPDSWDMKIEGRKKSGTWENSTDKPKASDPWEMKIEEQKTPGSMHGTMDKPIASDPWEMKIEDQKTPGSTHGTMDKQKTSDPWEMKIEDKKTPGSTHGTTDKPKASDPWEMKIEEKRTPGSAHENRDKPKAFDPWEMTTEQDNKNASKSSPPNKNQEKMRAEDPWGSAPVEQSTAHTNSWEVKIDEPKKPSAIQGSNETDSVQANEISLQHNFQQMRIRKLLGLSGDQKIDALCEEVTNVVKMDLPEPFAPDRSKTVLVAETDNETVELLKPRFRALNFENVDVFDDGLNAWLSVTSKQYDLIVINWDLPTLSGLCLYNRLRTHAATSKTPIVILSSFIRTEDFQIIRESLQTGYLKKPFKMEHFDKEIAAIFKDVGAYSEIEKILDSLDEGEINNEKSIKKFLNQLAKAIGYFDKAGTAIGRHFLTRSFVEAAENTFEYILSENPYNLTARIELCKIFLLTKQYEKAIEALQEASFSTPGASRLCSLSEMGFSDSEVAIINDQLSAVLSAEKAGPQSDARHAAGGARFFYDPDAVEALFRVFARALNAVAIAFIRKKEIDKGIKQYEAAMNFVYDNDALSKLYYNAGIAFMRIRKSEEASKWFTYSSKVALPSFNKPKEYLTRIKKNKS